MVRSQAYRILGIDRDTDKRDIKKRYRQLMHMVHPDANVPKENDGIRLTGSAGKEPLCRYTAQEINEAYEIICRDISSGHDCGAGSYSDNCNNNSSHNHSRNGSRQQSWDAPENPNAYVSRNVYHSVEDTEGNVLGEIAIASGRYIWKPEEDFRLFLKSMLECSRRILGDIHSRTDNPEAKLKFQAELAYLLTQQFIDAKGTLPELAGEPVKDGDSEIFHMSCMLEKIPARRVRLGIAPGVLLYPEKIKDHRLYLMNEKGQSAGYLSFKDDRMYYIIIPLLEHRQAQVKIQVRDTSSVYTELDFWIKIKYGSEGTFAENISLQIESLINRYKKGM